MSATKPSPSGYRGEVRPRAEERPQWEDYSKCIHCGLCLNDCPTYRLLGVEMDSPRGRIHQMILVDEGRLKLGESFVRHIDLCLDCRACETACPSGVEYGKLVEAARAQIEQNYPRPLFSRLLRWLGFRQVLPYPNRLALLGRLLRFYQRSGLQKIVRASLPRAQSRGGAWRLFGKLGQAEKLLPPMDDKFFFSELGQLFPAEGERRARVALFAGCIAQVAFSEMNRATIRVLQKNGCDVIVPRNQLCCGALHVHAGVRDVAQQLARANIEAFLRDDVDAIIVNSAGCGSILKEYEQLFPARPAGGPEDEHPREPARQSPARPDEGGRAAEFAGKVRDVTEFLVELGFRPPSRPPWPEPREAGRGIRVTYQDSCHLVHGQKIRSAPRELLRVIPGVELVEMKLADHCCGSAGIYNLVNPEISNLLLQEKMECARATGAQVIVTANPGCILQLRAGVQQFQTGLPAGASAKAGLEVLHLVELLDRAYD